jgi:hypothetical protein
MSRFLKQLGALVKPTRGRRSSAPRGQQARPRVEALEDRYLMTLPGIIGLPSTPADWINVDYQSLGGPSGFMGHALSGVNPVGDNVGFYQQFQGGEIFYSPATNAHFVAGAILGKYGQYGGPQQLGYPLNDMVGTADGGFHSVFQGSSWTSGQAAIYWSPNTQASLLYGPVYQHWMALGGPSGLGYPTWDEHASGRGDGLGCDFTNASGPSTIMYCTTTHSIGALSGPILQKYAALGWEYGVGYPTNDVHPTGRGDGLAEDFMQGSVPTTIMWCQAAGAHPVSGNILSKYAQLGWEYGLGYPTSDGQGIPGGQDQFFQNGKIVWTPQSGAQAVQAVTQMTFTTGPLLGTVSGWSDLTVFADGTYHFTGQFHDSGIGSYNDSVMWSIKGTSGTLYVFPGHSGHMAGTFESGSRDDIWDVTGSDPRLAANWADLEGCQAYWQVDRNWDGNSLFDKLVSSAGLVLAIVAL